MSSEVTTAEVYRTLLDFRNEVRQERAEERERARILEMELTGFQTEIRKAIFVGNGEPGLVSRVTRNEAELKTLWRTVGWVGRGASAAIGAAIGWALGPK